MLLLFCLIPLWFAEAGHSDENRPVLQEITLPRKLVEKQNIRLNCDLMQGSKPIKFSWFFNDEAIRESDKLQVIVGEDQSSLVIRSLSVDSVGRYKCVGANDHGSDQQTVAVYVNSRRTELNLNSHLLSETKLNITNHYSL